jgi:hypothetical protein
MMAGATDFHHVNLGRVFALLAAILAARSRRAAARLARALVLRLVVSHFRVTSFNCSPSVGNVCVSQVSTREAIEVKPIAECGFRIADCHETGFSRRCPASCAEEKLR